MTLTLLSLRCSSLGPAAIALAVALFTTAAAAAEAPTKVKLSIDEDPVVVRLAESLGYFKQEGIEIVIVSVESVAKDDYYMQEPLMKGAIDASYHWFNHTIFGARHGFPITAVIMFNDAPAMTVMVANKVKDAIRSVADFRGRRIAEGAGYAAKSVITGYMTQKAGLPPKSYTPVMLEHEGRQLAIERGLKDGTVDVITAQEPGTSALLATGMVTPLYDMNSKEATTKVLGAAFPAQSLLMSPDYVAAHPDTTQHLVNAFVRAMRFINGHTVEEIVAKLPADYFAGKDRAAAIALIGNTFSNYAKGDYAFDSKAVALVVDAIRSSQFDQSEEGQWRAGGDDTKIVADRLYTNRFVQEAMTKIK